jgi:enoyl-CoA hydratase/carnithine racemase
VNGTAGTSYDAWNRAWRDVGTDPENVVLILTGTGDRWLQPPSNAGIDPPTGHAPKGRQTRQIYLDAVKNTENFLFSFDIPTIGAINGPAPFHFATGLLCDITLCSDDTVFQESHCALGTAPGDGLAFVFQELMGVKRAAYYLYRSAPITAAEALDLGLVNEVVPRERLLPRAWEIAEEIAAMPPLARLMAKQVIRRRWLKVHADEAAFQMAHEMLGAVVEVPEGTAMTGRHWAAVERGFEQAAADAAASAAGQE